MFTLSFNYSKFREFINKVSFLCKDSESPILIKPKDTHVDIFYNNINKTNFGGFFFDKIESNLIEGRSLSYFFLSIVELKKLKLLKNDKKVKIDNLFLVVDKNQCIIKYEVTWLSSGKVSNIESNLSIVEWDINKFKISEDLLEPPSNYIKTTQEVVKNLVHYCNFYREDATSKETKGSLLSAVEDEIVCINTDSTTAIKFSATVLENTMKNPVDFTLSTSAFLILDKFSSDCTEVKLYPYKNRLYAYTENSAMCLPGCANKNALIPYKDLFHLHSSYPIKIEVFALKQALLQLTAQDTQDVKLNLNFDINKVNLYNQSCKIDNLPYEGSENFSAAINVFFLLLLVNRFLKYETILISFDEENKRWSFKSEDNKFICLAQGIS